MIGHGLALGQKNMTMKQVIRIVSPDTHVFEMHDPSKGEHSKTMEITYIRQGKRRSAKPKLSRRTVTAPRPAPASPGPRRNKAPK